MRGETLPSVSVIGLGYIGLPTAAVIARAGMHVHGVDVSQAVVDTINRGEIHIEEVDLDGLVQGVVQATARIVGTAVSERRERPIKVADDGEGQRRHSYLPL